MSKPNYQSWWLHDQGIIKMLEEKGNEQTKPSVLAADQGMIKWLEEKGNKQNKTKTVK